ncbi:MULTISPECIES: IS21-like element helper ATPase IstB [unclassified Oceanispirochaeta]|uniref:IS21-like element helper ATPase IstB n=1 Tax=unclassified Oceanispirochaeta TaxID=2635722 RepID=UPI000E08ED5A|nr:ATP-binding protein [Oceanispirochaeta sp. M2]NPD75562.1 ATP-binding protein [Oceanispirochaeta sp. M1]RDG28579.1 ATP-binding protein [Oceanispirochaeta sp. M1]
MNNNQATLSKLEEMRLHGMSRAFQSILETGMNQKFTIDELLTQLVDTEWEDRIFRKQERLLKAAGFRYQASIEELDYRKDRNLDKNMILRLSDGSWIKQGKDILITGPTGTGKSFIGSALGNRACSLGYRTVYRLTSRLFQELNLAKKEGKYLRELAKIYRADVLILEDFGLAPFTQEKRLELLDILEDRHGRKSTIIISQLPVSAWHGVIGESTIADAIMDRIVYESYRIELEGDSFRKKRAKNID